MKIAKGLALLLYFPCIAFAITKDPLLNEIYFAPKFHLKTEYAFEAKDDFFSKNTALNSELHFQYLDFNASKTQTTSTFRILPTYDFSKQSDIEEYQNRLSRCRNCFTLFEIKFPFF